MRIIDVTGTIENGMWEYGPPYPKVEIEQVASIDDGATIAEYSVNAHRISFSSSSATYVQTAAEMIKGVPSIDEIPVENFIREAVLIRFPDKKGPLQHITVEELEGFKAKIKPGDAVIVHTGWEEKWNKENFVTESPHFTVEAMDWILDKGISILAGDMTVYDDFQEPTGLLKKLFQKGVLVVAPLVNLFQIKKDRVKLIALPLKVRGVSGCPCRVVIIEE